MGYNVIRLSDWSMHVEPRQDSDITRLWVGFNIKNTHIRMCVIWELRKNGDVIIIVKRDRNYNYGVKWIIVDGDINYNYSGRIVDSRYIFNTPLN
jgi:hypothetical protein